MKRNKEHCNFYATQDTPTFKIKEGDCTRPVNGRFQPHECTGVCNNYDDTAYKIKSALARKFKGLK